MKAAYITAPGPADSIQYGDLPTPILSGKQILVRTRAVSVNPVDTYIRSGMVQMDLPMPFVIGCDVAGIVEAVGPNATKFRVGDRVWGSNQGLLGRQGTFSELVAMDEQWLYPIPHGVPEKAAAACALVGITAHLGLFRHAQLKKGETVFVNGGSGGVGSMVIQMAKIAGARVVTTAGNQDKMEVCKELGADLVLNYRTDDVATELSRYAPAGVHVWWETIRNPDFDLAVNALAARGRMILMAGREARPAFPVGPFYVKECSLHGFVMFKAKPDEQEVCARDINRWLSNKELKPLIDRVMRLEDAAQAHALQEDATIHGKTRLKGKIILEP